MQSISNLRLFIIWSVYYVEANRLEPLVYMGVKDVNNEFPFVVSIQLAIYPYSRMCTGSLLSETWVITAGHCIVDIPMIIRYSNFTLRPTSTTSYIAIKKIFIHPNFGSSVLKNDNALIMTGTSPKKSFAKLSAVDYRALLGLPVKYAGFGFTTKDVVPTVLIKEDEFRPLQLGEGVVTPCDPPDPMFGPAICIAPKCSNRHQDTRQGDSGGPLVYNGKIIGVLIGGYAEKGPISYYAPVSPNLDWMLNVMKTNS